MMTEHDSPAITAKVVEKMQLTKAMREDSYSLQAWVRNLTQKDKKNMFNL